MKFWALVACHNRRELTVRSLCRAQGAATAAGIEISFVVYDDGSTDGTSAAIGQLAVEATVIRGDGSAFWARSMALAETRALGGHGQTSADYLLWLNDDVVLDSDGFKRLIDCIRTNPNSVIVGAVRDPENGETTYSGMRRSGRHPLRFERVEPAAAAQVVETFNGNLVLVPIDSARRLGGIDGGFSHGLADIDYGLRCVRAGIPVILAPGTYGTCPRNVPPSRKSVLHDWHAFLGPKGGGNLGSLRRILRKSNPTSWPVYVIGTYFLWWTRRMLRPGVGTIN